MDRVDLRGFRGVGGEIHMRAVRVLRQLSAARAAIVDVGNLPNHVAEPVVRAGQGEVRDLKRLIGCVPASYEESPFAEHIHSGKARVWNKRPAVPERPMIRPLMIPGASSVEIGFEVQIGQGVQMLGAGWARRYIEDRDGGIENLAPFEFLADYKEHVALRVQRDIVERTDGEKGIIRIAVTHNFPARVSLPVDASLENVIRPRRVRR